MAAYDFTHPITDDNLEDPMTTHEKSLSMRSELAPPTAAIAEPVRGNLLALGAELEPTTHHRRTL